MLTRSLPGSITYLLDRFRGCFTTPTFTTFCGLAYGFWAQPGLHTVCGMLIGARLQRAWHHSRAHRFFATARWSADQLGLILLDRSRHRRRHPPSRWPHQGLLARGWRVQGAATGSRRLPALAAHHHVRPTAPATTRTKQAQDEPSEAPVCSVTGARAGVSARNSATNAPPKHARSSLVGITPQRPRLDTVRAAVRLAFRARICGLVPASDVNWLVTCPDSLGLSFGSCWTRTADSAGVTVCHARGASAIAQVGA
jgi:hypothetical protein